MPLIPWALSAIRATPCVPGSPWLIPVGDPSQPISNHVLNLWLQRAKERAGVDVKGLQRVLVPMPEHHPNCTFLHLGGVLSSSSSLQSHELESQAILVRFKSVALDLLRAHP